MMSIVCGMDRVDSILLVHIAIAFGQQPAGTTTGCMSLMLYFIGRLSDFEHSHRKTFGALYKSHPIDSDVELF